MPTSDVKVAAALIVKGTDDEAPHLKRCLENIKDHVDGIFLNVNTVPPADDTVSGKVLNVVSDTLNDKPDGFYNYIVTDWHDDFSEARNANFAQVPENYDWILYLDVDDSIDKPEKVRKVCEKGNKYDSIYVDYLYDRDEEDNPMTVHMVARLVKNNGSHQWKGIIHETLIENRSVLQGATKDFIVIHHADEERKDNSLLRNVELLERQLENEKEVPDPRTFYYLASTYMDCGKMESAKELFETYMTMSGWDQERSAASTKLGTIYLRENNTDMAKTWFMRAIGEDPDNPEPRVEMGSLELELKQYKKAQQWLEGVEKMEKNITTLERNPVSYTFRTYLLLADVYLGMGGKWLEKALEYAKRAQKYRRKDKSIRKYVKMVENVVGDKQLTENWLKVYKALKDAKETDKLDNLVKAIPKRLDDNPIMVRLRDQESYKWPHKSIVIMTGDTVVDEWGPWSLEEGIGGSEEAVIRLSRQLSKLGYKVVIYAKPGPNAGIDKDGVMWRNFWECNIKDEFDIFISWRSPAIFDNEITARKKYLWLHDVIEAGEFTPPRLANLDKVIVLSKYHRSLYPMIPDEKIFLSANGIDPEGFVTPKETILWKSSNDENAADYQERWVEKDIKRDPHKMIYASSHVRGLAYLYEIWPEVKKAVPDATLDVYYGRESYDAVHRGNPERIKWMDDMIAKAKELDGVTDHGKVSQDKIIQQSFKSSIWPYPCPFPEISCITALKCQAAGAIPVSSNFAALDETVQFGVKIPMKQQKEGLPIGSGGEEFLRPYKDTLINMLKDTKRQESIRPKMMKEMRKHSWSNIAKEWDIEFSK